MPYSATKKPIATIFLLITFVQLHLLYLVEYSKALQLNNLHRSVLFLVISLGSSFFTYKIFREDFLITNARKFVVRNFLIIPFVLALANFIVPLFVPDPHVDEIFRLSFAQNISALGLPPSRRWWVLDGEGYVPYYVFTEYFSVASGSWIWGANGISEYYLKILPILLKIFNLLVLSEIVQIYSGPTLNRAFLKNIIILGFGFLVVSFGITPYVQGQHHLTYRQNSFANLFLLILVAIGKYLLRSKSSEKSKAVNQGLILLTAAIPSLICSIKIMYLPVAYTLWFSLIVAAIGFKHVRKITAWVFVSLLQLFLTISATGIIAGNRDTTGGITWAPFELIRSLGGWLSPFPLSDYQSAGFIFVTPIIILTLLFFDQHVIPRVKINGNTAILGSLLAAASVGLILGSLLKFGSPTGDSESYWLISAWFVLAVGCVVALANSQLRNKTAIVAVILSVASATLSIWSWQRRVVPGLSYDYANVARSCRAINSRLTESKVSRVDVLVAFSDRDSPVNWSLGGFCGLPIVAAPGPRAPGYGFTIKNHPSFDSAYAEAQMIFRRKNTTDIVGGFFARHLAIKQLYLILRREDEVVLGDSCAEIDRGDWITLECVKPT